MSFTVRLVISALVAVVVGCGMMYYDKKNGAEWVVSPDQLAAANGALESRPGTVTVRPIRSETADMLPFKWAGAGIAAGILAFVATRRKTA
ncbi:hypothetical protein [Paracoccus aminophilus]|uniref:Uncharacterized protein n=1 Tax=Paracoccus aminophilus JCM 7686 TaxID=1367847 RepID=S5XPK9_PARAH|nr:hypothetical protein [Paracoccus aminophilus]AGT09279.1 hypothetical protein JCM7686_2200 [Paracoccus aminophilus JCM 7686]